VFTRSGFPTRWWHRGPPWFLPFADMLFRAKDAVNNIRPSRRWTPFTHHRVDWGGQRQAIQT